MITLRPPSSHNPGNTVSNLGGRTPSEMHCFLSFVNRARAAFFSVNMRKYLQPGKTQRFYQNKHPQTVSRINT